jgi:hypothetical protein
MTNQEKLEKLKEWLRGNDIPFDENYTSKSRGVTFDLRVKKPLIGVCISSERDREIFDKVKRVYAPFFIRESETAEFVIEKMQNCIVNKMMQAQRELEKKNKREEGKRIAEENERRHQANLAKKAAAEKSAKKAEAPKRKRQRIMRYEKV